MAENQVLAVAEWRKSWTVVMAAMLGVTVGSVHIYATGLFIQPIESEFGWSRTQITSGMTIIAFMGFLFSPLMGMLVDRWGARRIGLFGVIFYCGATAMLSLAGPSIWSWWALWFLVSVTVLGMKPTVWSAAVSSHFELNRGLAIAIAFCGTGVGSTIVPLLTNSMINEFGWRGAYMGLGLIFFIAAVPILFFFFFDARQSNEKKSRKETDPTPSAPVVLNGWSVRQGLRSRQFYQLAISALLITAVIVGFVVHIVPLLTESGIPRNTVVKIVSLIGIMSIIGRLTVGFLFDHFPGPPIGMVSVGLPMVAAILLLLFPGSMVFSIIAVMFLGLSVGGEYDAIIYLSTKYFGLRNYGSLFGMVVSLLVAGVGLGPIMAGFFYDISGDYNLFLLVAIPMCAITCVLIGTLGSYPDHEADAEHINQSDENQPQVAGEAVSLSAKSPDQPPSA